MAKPMPADREEEPLDPEMEKVRRKMVRLLGVSIAIMFIGLMAVLGAIVYKFTRPAPVAATADSAVPSEAPAAATLQVPQGFVVETMALDGTRLALYGRTADGARRVIIHDTATGRTVGELTVTDRP